MSHVTLYTTDHCAYCSAAKALLTKRGVDYVEVNLSRDPDSRAQLEARTGMFTFPQIVIGEEPIGGFEELRAVDREGRLPDLLAAA